MAATNNLQLGYIKLSNLSSVWSLNRRCVLAWQQASCMNSLKKNNIKAVDEQLSWLYTNITFFSDFNVIYRDNQQLKTFWQYVKQINLIKYRIA